MAKFNATDRDNVFLAGIAGYDDSIADMTPPVPVGEREELLTAIAQRINGIGGKVDNATETTAGIVKKAANVATAAGDNPTAAEFNALIAALIAAGIMSAASTD